MPVCSLLTPRRTCPKISIPVSFSSSSYGSRSNGVILPSLRVALPSICCERSQEVVHSSWGDRPAAHYQGNHALAETVPGDHLHVLLWATACIAFFGFLRMGEVTAVPNGPPPILMSGVAIDSHSKPTMIKLTLGRTKSDPFGTGTTVYLGKTGVQLCPVQAVLGYLAVRPPAQQGPLLVTRDGGPLSRECFVQHLKTALTALGVDHRRYSGHSFRIGAAAQAGIPDHLTKAMAFRSIPNLHSNTPSNSSFCLVVSGHRNSPLVPIIVSFHVMCMQGRSGFAYFVFVFSFIHQFLKG